MKRKSKTDLAREVSELTQRLSATQAELSDLRKSLTEAQQRRDETKQHLSEARFAIGEVNERLREATACRCQMIEVTAGDWRLFQTIDCPIHIQHQIPWQL